MLNSLRDDSVTTQTKCETGGIRWTVGSVHGSRPQPDLLKNDRKRRCLQPNIKPIIRQIFKGAQKLKPHERAAHEESGIARPQHRVLLLMHR